MVKVNKKIFTHLEAVSIYIYAARICGYTLTIHFYVMYIVYLKPIYTREREYTLSLTLSLASHFCHIVTLLLKKLVLFYHFWTCQRPNTTSLVYKNLRKVL